MRGVLTLSIVCGLGLAPLPAGGSSETVLAVVAKSRDLSQRGLWPGFEPARIPLEIFDGRRTWLIGHPRPPREFEAVAGAPGTWVFEGRHESARANEATEIAGVLVASASLEGRTETLEAQAALLLHEAFHVDQAHRHPSWGGNEVDLFLYPVDAAEPLGLRRLESASLTRAIQASTRMEAARWAGEAVRLRRRRFALIPASSAAYERGSEVKEGLARYIEAEALRSSASPIPAAEFAAAAVRDRTYASGCAIALLLDRLDPGWKERLDRQDDEPLDVLLDRAAAQADPREFSPKETEEAMRKAAADVAALSQRRASLRREYLDAPGWTLVVETPKPLFPQAFDPLNFDLLSPGEILHTRWLKLGNASGSIEVLGRSCLTEAAGKHPLFEGIRRVTITGLPAEPHFAEKDGHLTFSAEGVVLDLQGAHVTRSGKTSTVELK